MALTPEQIENVNLLLNELNDKVNRILDERENANALLRIHEAVDEGTCITILLNSKQKVKQYAEELAQIFT